jgi:hypothetical protein
MGAAVEGEYPKDSKSLSICGCDGYMLVVHGRRWRGCGSCFLSSTCICVKIRGKRGCGTSWLTCGVVA